MMKGIPMGMSKARKMVKMATAMVPTMMTQVIITITTKQNTKKAMKVVMTMDFQRGNLNMRIKRNQKSINNL